jgi:hypothetical protein
MSRKHINKVTAYLKPKQDALVKGFMSVNEMGQSETINMIVKDFFQRLPDNQKLDYLTRARSKNSYQ